MKTKKKRVDKYKNRNKPARKSWQKGQIMQIVRDPIGLFCGRCDAMKDEKTLKCPNRWTVGTLPISMMDYAKVLPSGYNKYFCIKADKGKRGVKKKVRMYL